MPATDTLEPRLIALETLVFALAEHLDAKNVVEREALLATICEAESSSEDLDLVGAEEAFTDLTSRLAHWLSESARERSSTP